MRTITTVLIAGLSWFSLTADAQFNYMAGPSAQRRIASGRDVPVSGAISPDGRSLAAIDATGAISVRDVTHGWGRIRELRGSGPVDRARGVPVWSPDGKQLAVGTASRILVLDVATGMARSLLRIDGANDIVPQGWSADGQQLLAISRPAAGTGALLWIQLRSRAIRAIPLPWIPDVAAASLDGRNVVVAGHGNQSDQLQAHLLTSDGRVVELDQMRGFRPIAWTPDGRHLLATRGAALWAFEIDDNHISRPPLLVSANLGTAFHGVSYTLWMGTTIAGSVYYKNATSTSDIYVATLDPSSGHVTSIPTPLPLGRFGFNVLPRWSADSREILYHRVEWSPAENLVYSLQSQTERRIASGASAAAMCWGNNGKTIVMTPFVGGNRVYDGLLALDVATGVQNRATSEGATGVPLSCAGDLVTLSSASGVVVSSLANGSTREVFTFQRPSATRPMLSHDGQMIAFTASVDSSSSALMTIPSLGGTARELARLQQPAEFQSNFGLAWSPDDRFVFYLQRERQGGVYELIRTAVAGGAPERVGLSGAELRDIDIAPNGGAIVFSMGGVEEQVLWAIDVRIGQRRSSH